MKHKIYCAPVEDKREFVKVMIKRGEEEIVAGTAAKLRLIKKGPSK